MSALDEIDELEWRLARLEMQVVQERLRAIQQELGSTNPPPPPPVPAASFAPLAMYPQASYPPFYADGLSEEMLSQLTWAVQMQNEELRNAQLKRQELKSQLNQLKLQQQNQDLVQQLEAYRSSVGDIDLADGPASFPVSRLSPAPRAAPAGMVSTDRAGAGLSLASSAPARRSSVSHPHPSSTTPTTLPPNVSNSVLVPASSARTQPVGASPASTGASPRVPSSTVDPSPPSATAPSLHKLKFVSSVDLDRLLDLGDLSDLGDTMTSAAADDEEWKLDEKERQAIVMPVANRPDNAPQLLAIEKLRAAARVVVFVWRLQTMAHRHELERREEHLKEFSEVIDLYTEMSRIWLYRAVKTALLSVINEPLMDLGGQIQAGKAVDLSPEELKNRAMKIKVRVSHIVSALHALLDDKENQAPTALLSFVQRYLIAPKSYFPAASIHPLTRIELKPAFLLPSEQRALEPSLNELGALVQSTREQQHMLVLNFFLTRIVIGNLLLRPWDGNHVKRSDIRGNAGKNLKILASVFYKMVRVALASPADETMESVLLPDVEILHAEAMLGEHAARLVEWVDKLVMISADVAQ
eukprot:TRINITY_DN9519_c0_g1_i6.p1 TRINITY_DN9519_c0_g1~~TRINITY_DN9519_c0_g1_i6.p1  ORF type:complete len:584 (-),score=134.88 TRINITY_DN9519_c0_g1_i6:42-1793(-)